MNFVRMLAMKTTFKKMKTSFRNKLNPRKTRAKMKGRAFKDLQAASRFSVCSSKKLKMASKNCTYGQDENEPQNTHDLWKMGPTSLQLQLGDLMTSQPLPNVKMKSSKASGFTKGRLW